VAVLAVPAADCIGIGDRARPDRRRRALGDGLQLEGCFALRPIRFEAADEGLHLLLAHVAAELGHDAAGVDRSGADSPVLVTAVELTANRTLAVFDRP
jgi:hypothetical protein